MNYIEVLVPIKEALALDDFKKMDYYAVEEFNLPIEIMMENAGLALAHLIASSSRQTEPKILIGIGNGNNGGGGLVAARRLAAWGFEVYLDLFTNINRSLPKRQLERALNFGAQINEDIHPDIWVDAYLGFSQKLPLSPSLLKIINKANVFHGPKIALDIPTGFLGDTSLPYFQADKVLTIAATKKILYNLPLSTDILIADIGIPRSVYQKFNAPLLPFDKSNILKLSRA